MIQNNFIHNNFCPICKFEELIDRKTIRSKNREIDKIFNLKECKNCNHKFLSKFPKEEFLNELYRNNSKYVFGHDPNEEIEKNKFKNSGFKEISSLKNHWIFNYLDLDTKGEYLEIGPGLCKLYKSFYLKNWICEGIELQPFIKAPGIVNNFEHIKNNSKDIVVALDVIEHTINPIKFLNNINTKLKKNGKLFLTFPNSDSFKSKLLNNKWDMVVPLAHINFFSKKSIEISLKKTNFSLIYIKNYSLANPKRLAKNFLKLPFKLLKDLLFFNFNNFSLRIKEFIICFLDILNGDQMKIIAKKIK